MFDSLQEWCNCSFNLHYYTGTAGTGEDIHAVPVAKKGYRVDMMTRITNVNGDDYISDTQIYLFDKTRFVTAKDMVSFEDGVKMKIQKIGGFFDGATGQSDLQVIYL